MRAKRRGISFDLSVEDIHVPDVCPALGIRLVKGKGARHDGSPSLDRLRPDQGYVSGNVVVVSDLANRIKQDATSEQVLAVADWMESLGL